jgi:hypothetical protein
METIRTQGCGGCHLGMYRLVWTVGLRQFARLGVGLSPEYTHPVVREVCVASVLGKTSKIALQ